MKEMHGGKEARRPHRVGAWGQRVRGRRRAPAAALLRLPSHSAASPCAARSVSASMTHSGDERGVAAL